MPLLEMIVGAIVEMGVQGPVESSLRKTKRQESVVKLLKKFHLDGGPPADDIESIYAYTLVEYGIFKPRPILDFFRNEFIRNAFYKSFEQNDFKILNREAEDIIHWNEETKKLGKIEYDPRREFAEFTAIFNEVVGRTRTPSEIRRDNNIIELTQKIEVLQTELQKLATLDEIREANSNLHNPQYSWESLKNTCSQQLDIALERFSNKFAHDLYVKREAEETFFEFVDSDKTALCIIDRAGRGKTNLLCSLARQMDEQGNAALLLRGDISLADEHAFETLICVELGYDKDNHRTHLKNINQLLHQANKKCIILLDGLSETETPHIANRALINLILQFMNLENFKICLTCRDVIWPKLDYDLPKRGLFYVTENFDKNEGSYELQLGDFRNTELDTAIPLYQQKYDVAFEPMPTARNQLKHPLLLRFFCEANKGSNLGTIYGVPTARTFDHYLQTKISAISIRLDRSYRKNTLYKFLLTIVGQMWNSGGSKQLPDSKWGEIFSEQFAIEEQRKLLGFLEEEGIVKLLEHPFTCDRSLEIVFDELQEFLLLKHLLGNLINDANDSNYTQSVANKLLREHPAKQNSRDDFKLISLIGMMLPEIQQREEFLSELQAWDFQTYCACLVNIPPTGSIADCQKVNIHFFAEKLTHWYRKLIQEHFELFQSRFDPWYITPSSEDKMLGIMLRTSIDCKEISYEYTLIDESELQIDVKSTDGDQTWVFRFQPEGKEWIDLHDPDSGRFITIFRPEGIAQHNCIRILNFKQPWFVGVSLNVPERIALFDIWSEIKHVIDKDNLPFESIFMIHERILSLSQKIPNLHNLEGLTIDSLKAQTDDVLSFFTPDSPEYEETVSKLNILGRLLSKAGKPLDLSNFLQIKSPSITKKKSDEMEDNELLGYIGNVIQTALGCYKVAVEKNFPTLLQSLNIYANMPHSSIVLSDGKFVKFVMVPVENKDDASFRLAKVENINPNALLRIEANDENYTENEKDPLQIPIGEHAESELKRLDKKRPPISSVDEIFSIDKFFTETPINDFVKHWLLTDLKRVFAF